MEEGKWLISGLRSRRNAKVAINLEDVEQIEDDMIYQAEPLYVHTTRWQDPRMIKELHIEEDFAFFLERTMLDGFVSRPYKTYAEITCEFLATFRFAYTKEKVGKKGKVTPSTIDVEVVMKQRRFLMSIDEFYKAINVPNVGSWEEIHSDSDEHLQEFWRNISVDVPLDIHRGKFSHVQHPG
jgi:hypothetical protein